MKTILSLSFLAILLTGCASTEKPGVRQRIIEAYRTGEHTFAVTFRLLLKNQEQLPAAWKTKPALLVQKISNQTRYGQPTATYTVTTKKPLAAGVIHQLSISGWLKGSVLPSRPRHIPYKEEVAAILKQYPLPRPKIPTLFIGSSSFRMWKNLEVDMEEFGAKNHGFGGAMFWMINHYYPLLIKPFRPERIVVYCGENDIAAGISPEKVRQEFKKLLKRIRRDLPDTKIYYCTMKPSPSRKKFLEKFKKANMMIRLLGAENGEIIHIDVASPMIDRYGDIRPDIWQADKLHMNRLGYTDIWIPVIRAALQGKKRPETATPIKPTKRKPALDRW